MNLSGFRSTAFVALLTVAPALAEPPAARVDFQTEVRPLLSDACFQCHGPDPATRLADLRLDLKDGAFAARENGRPVVPGDAQASLLYQRITHRDAARRMPPEYSHKKLEPEQIDKLRAWIDQGAEWTGHWSFEPPVRPEVPPAGDGTWAANPIDNFILARLQAEGLTPAAEADRSALARRAAFDITGLPPEPSHLQAFLDDKAPGAYERYLGRLLALPSYGEHRARYWLDAARYADTHGIHIDNYREMWPYRDWVINAYNRNLPFDRFTVEQIAGDLFPDPSLDQLIASGFHRCNATTNEGGVIPEEFEVIYAKDRADTTGAVFLGLTVGCATCHDHKFDPVTQKDFYRLTAFFRNTTQYVMDGNVSDTPPIMIVPRREERSRYLKLVDKARTAEAALANALDAPNGKFDAWVAKRRYRALTAPLDAKAETMAADPAQVRHRGASTPLTLPSGVEPGEGPAANMAAFHFGAEGVVELPPSGIERGKPFSMTLWVYHPDERDGDFIVAGQTDPEDKMRGWSITLNDRQINFRMKGVEDGKASTISLGPNNQRRLETGAWTHIAVTYDGSAERAGLSFYVNGAELPVQGGEYFTKLKGEIANDRPIFLGRGYIGGDEEDSYKFRYFSGGAIADFRIFNRVLSVEEAKVIANWALLDAARTVPPDELTAEQRELMRLRYLTLNDAKHKRLASQRAAMEREIREIRRRGAVTHVMQETPGKAPEAHVLFRGMYDQRRDRVTADTPGFLPPMSDEFPKNRLGLAKWIVADANPLTARVAVNRYWQEIFGTGLVRTSDDFGAQGEPPSHPKLLDWLAVDFRESGWDVKRLIKTMLLSSTYRQSAQATPEKLEKDPENRLLARGPRFRMDGETIRDIALAASGLLVRKIGGPSVKPYQPDGVWSSVAMPSSNTKKYERDSGEKLYRRSLYTFWKRAAPPASMQVFNAPTREHSIVRRERTNTPLQALVTMNDVQFVEAARHLAQSAMKQAGGDFDSRLGFMTTRLLSRDFNRSEAGAAKRSFEKLLAYYGANESDARDILATGESQPDPELPPAESAAYAMLANQIMNLDEVLNK